MRRLLPLFIAILGGLFLVAVRIFAQGGTTIYLPMVAKADIVTTTVVYTPTWRASIYSASFSGDYGKAYRGEGDWDGFIEDTSFMAKDCSRGCLVQRSLFEFEAYTPRPQGEVISASVVLPFIIVSYRPETIIEEPLNVHLGTWKDRNPKWHDFVSDPVGRWVPPGPEVHMHKRTRERIPLNAFIGASPPETIKLLFRLEDQNPPTVDHIVGEIWTGLTGPVVPHVELVVRVQP